MQPSPENALANHAGHLGHRTGTVIITPTPGHFWSRVAIGPPGECWLWRGSQLDGGYGQVYVSMQDATGAILRRTMRAHRLALVLHGVGLDPDLVVDHLCRVRLCVNPAHLEQVTQRENVLRGETLGARAQRTDACPRAGHEWTPENTTADSRGARRCRACHRERERERRARRFLDRPQIVPTGVDPSSVKSVREDVSRWAASAAKAQATRDAA